MTTDNLTQELQRFDPVQPGELEGALDSAHAAELLGRILSLELEPVAKPRRRRWMPQLVLGTIAAAAAILVFFLVGLPGGAGGNDRLAGALDKAAAAAASQPPATAEQSYTYLKTRELSVNTADADKRSWSVLQPATREEWVAWDGSGRLRVATGPPRFVGSGDRAEWEAAGSPNFLALGFGRRTEHRWLAAGLSRGSVEELPTDPAALATRLRYEAEVDHGELPVPAATLQLIAEDLRDPGASPALRQALYEAARRVPGIEYLGEKIDPEGKSGIAVGVTSSYAGGPALYSLIFDPDTAKVLATETTSLGPTGSAGPSAPTLLRAMVYLESREIESTSEFKETWLSGIDQPSAWGRSTTPFVVYRVPNRHPWPLTLDATLDEDGGARS